MFVMENPIKMDDLGGKPHYFRSAIHIHTKLIHLFDVESIECSTSRSPLTEIQMSPTVRTHNFLAAIKS